MSIKTRDGFEEYFTEKFWEMIPPLYRYEDGKEGNPNPGVLHSLIELLASQAAVLRRSSDHLWEDQFIELCQDWAVPYIGDLIGTRLVSSLNLRARRTDVAKTIYYRRRKGTLRVLEELVSDITGWDGKVVENFRRLARCRHGLDPEPWELKGSLTGTPPGGWADLRNVHGGELANGPFDEFHHMADMRQHRGSTGRFGIPKLAFHLYTMVVHNIVQSTPFRKKDENVYTFDPSGRNIPLFMPDRREENADWYDSWHSTNEWELASPVTCRLFASSMEARSSVTIWEDGFPVPDNENTAGSLRDNALHGISPKRYITDPENGKFLFNINPAPAVSLAVSYHYGFSGHTGAGSSHRPDPDVSGLKIISGGGEITGAGMLNNHINQITDSLTYFPVTDKTGIGKMTLRASDRQRPYISLNQDWTLKGADDDSELYLEGMWIGSSVKSKIILKGNFRCVVISHCTLDPGGDSDINNTLINPIVLEIAGHIDNLFINSCITGPILTIGSGFIENQVIRDSILQSVNGDHALESGDGPVSMKNVTVLGGMKVHRLEASEILVTGKVDVTDSQHGCFRFSNAPKDSILPRKYESWLFDKYESHWFVSQKFGQPGYARLSESASAEIANGAENGCETGAFNLLINAVKEESLMKKVEEYMPFGLIPIFIKEI